MRSCLIYWVVVIAGLVAAWSDPLAAGCREQKSLQKLVASDAATVDWFGTAAALDGDVAVLGTPGDDGPLNSGSVYVFRFDGATWVEEQRLKLAPAESEDHFGGAVAVGGGVIVVGASGDDGYRGSAYVYGYHGSQWILEQKLVASQREVQDFFGISVAVSHGRIIVGSHFAKGLSYHEGAAYVFRHRGSAWVEEQKLFASDGFYGDFFGYSVAIDQDEVLIGAYAAKGLDQQTGAAYVFRHDGNKWNQAKKLIAADGSGGDNWSSDRFGFAVAITGGLAAIAAPWDDDACPSDYLCNSGSVSLFRDNGGSWDLEQKIVDEHALKKDQFGGALFLATDVIAVGADQFDDSRSLTGKVLIFRRRNGVWIETQSIVPSDALNGDNVGQSVALSGNLLLIGAPQSVSAAPPTYGSAYLFDLHSANWGNYGSGWPGTLGVPDLTVGDEPRLGSAIALEIGNSLGVATLSLVMFGDQPTSWTTPYGGTLLVWPTRAFAKIIPPSGAALGLSISGHCDLAGRSFFLQVVEQDAGATAGISFSAGLELGLGF